jgi:hypothetical protein
MIAPWVFVGIFALLTLGCVHGIFHWLRKAWTMSHWPTVTGTIISSWDVLDGEKLRYAYAVNGHRYVGHLVVVSAGGPASYDATPQELVEKYPPGAQVTVYYNPKHCATAVLEPRSVKHAVFAAVMAAGFGYFALAFVAMGLRGGLSP